MGTTLMPVRTEAHQLLDAAPDAMIVVDPRLHAATLNELCHFFRLQPGKLLYWVP
jgi:hypothetical protein